MEVKIGVQNAARELSVETTSSPEHLLEELGKLQPDIVSAASAAVAAAHTDLAFLRLGRHRVAGDQAPADRLSRLRGFDLAHAARDLAGAGKKAEHVAGGPRQQIRERGHTLMHKPVRPMKLKIAMSHLLGQTQVR